MSPIDENPYQAPSAEINPVVMASARPTDEADRREGLRTERLIRGLGLINGGAACLAMVSIAMLIVLAASSQTNERRNGLYQYLALVMMLGFIALLFSLARGLAKLQPWAFAAQTPVSGTAILCQGAFAVTFKNYSAQNTAIAAMIFAQFGVIWLVNSRSAAMIRTADYRGLVARTPHLAPRPGLIMPVATLIASCAIAPGYIYLFQIFIWMDRLFE